jgi:hypothetical protein
MSHHKKSFNTVEKNKVTWTKNLVRFEESYTRRGSVPLEESSLEEKCRMPLQTQIIGRYQFLGARIKGRKDRIAEISKELMKLWENRLNFPHVSEQVIRAKLEKVLKTYDECVKRGKYVALDEFCDITKPAGKWLSTEDKKLYQLQVESKGKVGYSTGQVASKETIHPSKRLKLPTESEPSTSHAPASTSDTESEEDSGTSDESEDYSEYEDESGPRPPTRKHNKTKVATNLVIATKVSTRGASKICKQLSLDGIDIPTPSQPGIYNATFREAAKLKEEMIRNLQMEQWSLHFDGKHIEKNEYQVVVLENSDTEVKLDALRLTDGKAKTIADGIANVLNEYNLWNAVKMIVADTTSVNTGKKGGVVVRLQQKFSENGGSKPQFIGCQHHILDRILRVVMDEELGGKTKSPNIEYPFVSELVENYEELKAEFENGTEDIGEKSGWRDDMKFLFHLTRVFRFFEEKGHFPMINFQKIPNISNARWNSRAILALLAFILMPPSRDTLRKVCSFISYDWADYWFSDQMYNANDFENLSEILKPYKKALNSLENHWNKEPSALNVPRSNQCAERAIKVMQELYAVCVNKDKLQLRFILTNKH